MATAVLSIVSIEDVWDDGKRLHVCGTIDFDTGDYAAGGIAMPLAHDKIKSDRAPVHVRIAGAAGVIYHYVKSTKKVQIFCNSAGGTNGTLTEHTTAQLISGVSSDTINFYAIFPKYL